MVVNGGYPASLLCRCAVIAWKISGKQPLAILNIHNSATNPPWYFRAPESLIDQAVICSSSSIVNVSQASLETLNNRKAFVGCKKLRFIHNGIEEPRPPHSATEEVGSLEETDDCYCLMLATYQRYKGHDYLLKAFKNVVKEFPNCHLQIYGFEKTHEKLRVAIMVNQLSLEKNVSLNDFIHETKLLIQNAEIVVVPSQAFESFGLTIIEAMALGTPVVATNVGGLPEVVADSNAGYICSKNDPNEFAIAMKRILGDQSLAAELGRNGRRFFKERFTAKRMANQYEKIIKQSIEVKL
jgi:glycosyltransferase involved in cell wall biosynthesis